MKQHSPRLRSAGMTLVEVLISCGVMSVAVLIAAAAVNRSFGAWTVLNRTGDMERRAQAAMETIAAALNDAGKTQLSACAPANAAFSLTFKPSGGFSGGSVTWKNTQIIEWQASMSDPINGTDNDKNGLIDDGVVVLRKNVGLSNESTTVLCRDVPLLAPGEASNTLDDNGDGLKDERGLSFSLTGNALRVRLSLIRRAPDGTFVITTAERTIALRN